MTGERFSGTLLGIVLIVLLPVAVSLSGCGEEGEMAAPSPPAEESAVAEETTEPALYERLGGVYNIAAVVDDFIERLLINDTLNANPAIAKARDSVPKAGLKYRVTELVCQATGGPCKYSGRSMKGSHAHLDITEQQWQAMGADFKATLDAFNVPDAEQEELFAIVETTKGDIVVPSQD